MGLRGSKLSTVELFLIYMRRCGQLVKKTGQTGFLQVDAVEAKFCQQLEVTRIYAKKG